MLINTKGHLHGKNNKRLNSEKQINNEGTAAWQNSEAKYEQDLVNKPSLDCVIDAKDWVDNGSKL